MEQIGRYKILGELGRGATGVVYRAQDPAIGRIIAIKTIRLSDITDDAERERLRERLFREAQSAGILSHPNIVTIYDIAEANGLAYIFMECVDGPPLEKILNSPEPLLPEGVISILRQTATALDYAHKKGIVHRDIKPANILIHEGTLAKITDFGVAKILSQQMTQAGVMMGTPNYMSPEQVQGHAVDGRADQFSLAVIAYEILTGEKPYVADHLPSLLYRIVREDPVPPQRLNPTLAPQVEVIFRKALSKSASDRYPTAVEFVDALAEACNLNPKWHPLPRSTAATLPTVGGAAAMDQSATGPPSSLPTYVPEPVVAPEAPLTRLPHREDEDQESRSPVLKSLAWMLVGIGLVGLVLLGAQKYLFTRNQEPAAQTQPQPDNSTPPTSKPSPVGQPDQTPKEQPKPETPPETTKPETPKPAETTPPVVPTTSETAPAQTPPEEKPKVEQPQPKPPRREVSTTPPSPIVARPNAETTVQFLTEPSGANVTVDSSSSLACKAPCMLTLAAGRHVLSVQLAGYRSYPRVFNVPQDGDIFMHLSKAEGTLSVTSNISGATIEINNELQSQRTPALFKLPPGTYRVHVSKGGASIDFDAEIKDQAFVSKRVTFQ